MSALDEQGTMPRNTNFINACAERPQWSVDSLKSGRSSPLSEGWRGRADIKTISGSYKFRHGPKAVVGGPTTATAFILMAS
jgi:hypothetical protein